MNASVSKAWYRHPMVWVVLAPPIGSVIAGVITMILILNHPDREVRTHPTTAVLHGSRANSIVPPAD